MWYGISWPDTWHMNGVISWIMRKHGIYEDHYFTKMTKQPNFSPVIAKVYCLMFKCQSHEIGRPKLAHDHACIFINGSRLSGTVLIAKLHIICSSSNGYWFSITLCWLNIITQLLQTPSFAKRHHFKGYDVQRRCVQYHTSTCLKHNTNINWVSQQIYCLFIQTHHFIPQNQI